MNEWSLHQVAAMLLLGLVVFAVLVGIATDSVASFMRDVQGGRTLVAEQGHTLILGWNESTVTNE
jgi:hypothetical protein